MTSGITEIFDETFQESKSDAYHLSVLLSRDVLQAAVLDKVENRFLAVSEFILDRALPFAGIVEKLLGDKRIFRPAYRSVSVTWPGVPSTLVPNALFSTGKEASFMKLSSFTNDKDHIASLSLRGVDAKIIFSMNEDLRNIFSKKYSGVIHIPSAAVLLEHVLLATKNLSGKRVSINVLPGIVDIVVTDGNKLIFQNSFPQDNPDELVYYVMNVFETLQLNPEKTNLSISGQVEKNSVTYELFRKYIRTVELNALPEGFRFAYPLEVLPRHQFVLLFGSFACV